MNRCDECGRFMSWWPYDQFTYYGSALDFEPPDAHFMCERCFWREVAMLLVFQPDAYWRRPWAWAVASSIRRHNRRHPDRPVEVEAITNGGWRVDD